MRPSSIRRPQLPGRISLGLTAGLVLHAAAMPLHAARYTISDLGTFKSSSFGHALNDLGHAIGDCMDLEGQQSFLHRDGDLLPIPLYGAIAINNAGKIAGLVRFGNNSHAALYEAGEVVDLGTFGGAYSYARGMNEAGVVVGVAQRTDGTSGSFFYKNGEIEPVGGADFRAYGINNHDDLVGISQVTPGRTNAMLVRADGSWSELADLGGQSNWPTRINDVGQIVGYAKPDAGSSVEHAVVWASGHVLDLRLPGELSSRAYGVNNQGQIVGHSHPGGAVLWENGIGRLLSTLLPPDHGWTALYQAFDINEAGQIIGYGELQGQTRAFLMTPVPEPVTSAAAACLFALAELKRLKKRAFR